MQGIKFDFNSFTKKIHIPWLYIGDANQRIKHTIPSNQVYDLKMSLFLNNISEMTFKIYKYYYDIDGTEHELPAYDYFNGNFITIHTEGYGEWSLYCYDENSEGSNPNKSITAKSLEVEFCNTKIYGYGNASDDSEDLPLYKLVNYDNKEYSALHVALAPLKHWSIGYISPNISTTAHTIEWDENNSYDFLCTTVAESFSCFFVFDTVNKRVNAYKASDSQVAKDTNIYLAFNNLLKSVGLKWNMSEIKTILEVVGGSNSDGTNFGISDINLGNNQINNFDFVYQFWSDGLKSAWDRYQADETTNKSSYEQYSQQLETLYIELESLNSKATSETDYTNMGYTQLCIQRDAKLAVISSYNGLSSTSITQQQYTNAVTDYNSILSTIVTRISQIKSKESAIDTCIQNIANIILDFEDYCTSEQYIEFSRYNRVDTYQNDDYCTYDSTTVSEYYTLARELKSQAEEELIAVCYPRFELSIDCLNFTQIEAFKNYTDILDLGDLIHIDYSCKNNGDNHLYARILEIDLDFDNPDNISFTLSNKDSLDEKFRLKEIQSQSQSSATSLNYNYSGLKSSTKTASKLSDYMANDRDLMNQRIISDTEEIIINNSGLLARSKTDSGYLPQQLFLGHGGLTITDSNWEIGHTKVGIGLIHLPNGQKLYGFSGEVVYGNLLLGSQLEISNDSANLLFNNDGMTVSNSTHNVKINPNNPSSIIEITSGTDKIFYIDATTKKLTMSGTVTASDIIGSTITGNTISGGSITGASITNGNGTFSVTNSGSVRCSDLTVTGGSFNIGSRFIVNTSGDVTCSSLTATGGSISGTSFSSTSVNGSLFISGGLLESSASGSSNRATITNGSFTVNTGSGYSEISAGGISTNIHMSYKGSEVINKSYLESMYYTQSQSDNRYPVKTTTESYLSTLIDSVNSLQSRVSSLEGRSYATSWDISVAIGNHVNSYHSPVVGA